MSCIIGGASSGTDQAMRSGSGKRRWEESRVAQPEGKIGQQTLEIDFLKGCLQRIEEQRQLQAITGSRYLPANPNQRERAEALSLKRMCALAGVSRRVCIAFARPAKTGSRSGAAGCHPTHRLGVS